MLRAEGISLDKKRILFVIPYLHCGGAERVVGNLTLGLNDGFDIDILVNSTQNVDYAYGGRLISIGIDRVKSVDSPLFQLYALIRRTIKLIKLKNTGGYDICISHLDSAHIANILSANKRCKTVLTAHSTMSEAGKNWKYRLFIVPAVKNLYNKADSIIAVSKGIAQDFVNNFGLNSEKITVIYNGIDIGQIEEEKKEILDDSTKKFIYNKRVFCNIGRLDYPKAQWHLIRAFSIVVEAKKDAVLLIVGDGDIKSYLSELIEGLGLSDHVMLTGFQSNPYKYFANSDVFVFPSMFEGFPNAPVEALQLGLPVITTDFNNGAREILTPETAVNAPKIKDIESTEYGYMTPLCDGHYYLAKDDLTYEERKLAETMLRILDDIDSGKYGEDYVRRAKERAQFFSLKSMVEGWKKLINEI